MFLKGLDKHAGLLTILWTLTGYLACIAGTDSYSHLNYRQTVGLMLLWLAIWLMLAIAALRRGNRISHSCIAVTVTALLAWIFSIFTASSGYRYSGPGNWYPEIPAGAPILTIYTSSPGKEASVRFHRHVEGFIHLLGLRPTAKKATNAYPPWFLSDYKDGNIAIWSNITHGKSSNRTEIFGASVTLAPHNTDYPATEFNRLAASLEEFVKYNSTTKVQVVWRIATGTPRKTQTQTAQK